MTDFTNGVWRSLVDGKAISAIPDSAVAQYDATQETGFNDGDAIGSLTDFDSGDDDLSNGTAAYRTGIQNGNAVIRYDGVDDGHHSGAGGFSLTQPYTIIAVVVDAAQAGDTEAIAARADGNDNNVQLRWNGNNGNWEILSSNVVAGSTTSAPVILSGVFDGSSSLIRENGTQTGSGDAGTADISSINVGAINGNGAFFLNGDIGELLIYNSNLDADGDLSGEETRLSDKWGITI